MAVKFYHDLLYKNRPQYEAQWKFLATWDMEQPDLRKYKVGYCPDTSPFVKHYEEILTTYVPIREALKKLGIIKENEQGLKDALEGYYFFPVLMKREICLILPFFTQRRDGDFCVLKTSLPFLAFGRKVIVSLTMKWSFCCPI